VWLQARHTDVKVFLAAFLEAASEISAAMSERVFLNPTRDESGAAQIIRILIFSRTINSKARPSAASHAGTATGAHAALRPDCHSVAGQKIINCGQKTAPNCRAAANKGIKVYRQLAVRLPAT
jgi:hypothetical protein